MAAIKVLLADDDESMLGLLSDNLRHEGFEVTTASSAQEALRLVCSETYDVLLSEENMHGAGDGLTILSVMRHVDPKTVTILLSAPPRMGADTQATLENVDEILLKAIDPHCLTAVIKERVRSRVADVEHKSGQWSNTNGSEADHMLTMVHELRTPLTSIRGSLGLLADGRLGAVDEKVHRLLMIALKNADRMIRLINSELDRSRFESGLAILQIRRCSFSDLLRQAIEEISTTADLARVAVSVPMFALPDETEIFLDTDPDMILQVLTNLLANAIKFSPGGSEILVEIETPPNLILFRIVDQGRGIPEEQLESIFERFHQVEKGDGSHGQGSGLGLAICRVIVQQHGGTITAARNLGRGSTFTVILPRTQRASDDIETGQPVLVCAD